MWENNSFSISQVTEELKLTESQVRTVLSKMQDRVEGFSRKLKNGERRLNNLEVAVIEFIYLRTNKEQERSQDAACDLAAKTFYRDNKPEIIKGYLESEIKRLKSN